MLLLDEPHQRWYGCLGAQRLDFSINTLIRVGARTQNASEMIRGGSVGGARPDRAAQPPNHTGNTQAQQGCHLGPPAKEAEHVVHSLRSAASGSRRAARRAGIQHVTKVIAMTAATIAPRVSGSAGPTPNRNVFSPVARATATTRPTPTPSRARRRPSPKINRSTSPRWAPTAMRIAISVRRE